MSISYTGFDTIQSDVVETLRYLHDHDSEVSPNTIFGKIVAEGLKLIEFWKTDDYPEDYDYHHGVGNLANLHSLCRIILGSRNTQFEKSLSLLE